MKFSIGWFLFGILGPYSIWLLSILIREGPEGIIRRKKREPKGPPDTRLDPATLGGGAERQTPPPKAPFKPGFRNLNWGDPPTPGMSLLKSEGDESLYMRTGDSMKIGEAELSSIHYQYWRGRFAAVAVEVAPGSVGKAIDALRVAYGNPSQPKQNKSKYYWLGLGSGEGATQAMLDTNSERQSGMLVIFSRVIADERKPGSTRDDTVSGVPMPQSVKPEDVKGL